MTYFGLPARRDISQGQPEPARPVSASAWPGGMDLEATTSASWTTSPVSAPARPGGHEQRLRQAAQEGVTRIHRLVATCRGTHHPTPHLQRARLAGGMACGGETMTAKGK